MHTMPTPTRRVTLSPIPGYCVKTKIQQSSTKVFLNIAWDPLVPPPPTGTTPEAIEDPNYVIPLIISSLKDDKDKKGVACKVVDCVYSKELKSKSLRETDFKQFLSLVALEHVEEKHGLRLSRSLASPNIAFKGKLESQSVEVPVYESQSSTMEPTKTNGISLSEATPNKKPLIEEILAVPGESLQTTSVERPKWSLSKLEDGGIRIDLDLPKLTRELAQQAILDVEPRRIIFSAGSPLIYALDQEFPSTSRDFRIESAKAEWSIATKRLTITL